MKTHILNLNTLFSILILAITTPGIIKAQELTQTVRGKVIDLVSTSPVVGAHITIINSDPVRGSGTGLSGEFRIEDVPVGRVSLKVTCIGYEEMVLSNLLLTSTKELVLELPLTESVVKMEEITIHDDPHNGEVLNEMTMVSARVFSVEETKRYAGSFNDPARMVSAFAGIMPAPEGDNYIAVRGNSPKGNQWRLEGIEIPNPNHFSDEGATGGPINALNSAMLANSDFLTGAFPAEYGNAFSGIFDMKLRNGNNQKREYSVSAGVIGTDITFEGPFKKSNNSSYLVNYRYSTLALLEGTGIVDFDGVPKYQDLSFKIHIPAGGAGYFSIFGLAGKSNLKHELPSAENEDVITSKFNVNAELAVAGLNHIIPLSRSTYLESGISFSENGSLYDDYSLEDSTVYQLMANEHLRKYTISGKTILNSKINAHHNVSAGMIYTQLFYDFYAEYYNKAEEKMQTEQDEKGNSGLLQLFGNWKYRINNQFTLTGGIHFISNRINNTFSLEPRAGLKWQFTPAQSLTFGFGVHSKMEPLPIFFMQKENENGIITRPNRELDFSKSRHYVLGYQNHITPNLVLKLEAYYQDLYDIAIENEPESTYSMLNTVSWYTSRRLINSGSGYNYGLEMTLERFFGDTYYFMVTGSLYNSKYRAMDGILRDSRFNGNYVGNVLFGKEWIFSSRPGKSRILGINTRISLIGARRFTPIDLEESRASGYTKVYENQAFTLRGDDIFIANLGISYRINRKRTSQEIKLDIQNITNNQGIVDQYYNPATDKIEKIRQLGFLPNIMYTIEF